MAGNYWATKTQSLKVQTGSAIPGISLILQMSNSVKYFDITSAWSADPFCKCPRKRSGLLWEGRYKISPIDTDAYRQFVEQADGSPSDELIRAAINSNKLTGSSKFVDEIESRIGIRVETRKPGRPN